MRVHEEIEEGLPIDQEVDLSIRRNKIGQITLSYNIWSAVLGGIAVLTYRAVLINLFGLFYPILGMLLVWRTIGLVSFADVKKVSPYESVISGVFISVFLLLVSFTTFYVTSYKTIWIPVFCAVFFCFGFVIVYVLSTKQDLISAKTGIIALATFSYAFSNVVISNFSLDDSTPVHYTTVVSEKFTEVNRGTTYVILFKPWRNNLKPQSMVVEMEEYDAIKVGDSIYIKEKEGYLRLPWFVWTERL